MPQGIPVVIVDNGTPATVTNRGMPITIVGGSAAPVSNGDPIQVETQGGAPFVSASIELQSGVPVAVLPAHVSIIGDAQAYQVPVVGTYTNTITVQVNASGVITGYTLS